MNKNDRRVLICFGILMGGFLPFAVFLFGAAVGDDFGLRDILLGIGVTLLIASPLLLPALIPEKYKLTSRLFRWIGAFVLLIPLYYYFSSQLFQKAIEFLKAKKYDDLLSHLPFGILVCVCVYSIWLLIKCDIASKCRAD